MIGYPNKLYAMSEDELKRMLRRLQGQIRNLTGNGHRAIGERQDDVHELMVELCRRGAEIDD